MNVERAKAIIERTDRIRELEAEIRSAGNMESLYSGAFDDKIAELHRLRAGAPVPSARRWRRLRYAYYWVRRFLGIDGPTEFERWQRDEEAAGAPRIKKIGRYV